MAFESQSHHPSPTIINRHQPSSPSQSLLKNCFLRQHPSQEYKKDEDDDPSRRHISLTVERNGGRFFLLCSFSLVVTHHHPRNNTNTKTLLERSKTGVDLKPPLSATLPCRDRSWVRFLLFNRQNRKKIGPACEAGRERTQKQSSARSLTNTLKRKDTHFFFGEKNRIVVDTWKKGRRWPHPT